MASTREDDEDLRGRYCVPLSSLTAPVEVGDIGSVDNACLYTTDPDPMSYCYLVLTHPQDNTRRLLRLLRLASIRPTPV